MAHRASRGEHGAFRRKAIVVDAGAERKGANAYVRVYDQIASLISVMQTNGFHARFHAHVQCLRQCMDEARGVIPDQTDTVFWRPSEIFSRLPAKGLPC